MNTFAKLYETDIGQIVVMRHMGEDEPEIRIYINPNGNGVCWASVGFSGCDAGRDAANRFFAGMTAELAVKVASEAFDTLLMPKTGIM